MPKVIGPNVIGPEANAIGPEANAMGANGLFIFRRDFRITDNTGLNLLNAQCKHVFTIFVFTPEQVTNANKFKSANAVQFMIESLADLAAEINKKGGKLYTFYGKNETIIEACIKAFQIDVVGFNIDYSPYAIKRDHTIRTLCKDLGIPLLLEHDYYLHQPGTILTGGGLPYQKFTPYYQSAMKKPVALPAGIKKIKFSTRQTRLLHVINLKEALQKFVTEPNPDILVHGGRQNAVKMLHKPQKHYATTHNELWKPTSQLSAYIKFGCLSIREVYHAYKHAPEFIRQLIWRDFYANILFSFPHVLGHAMKQKYEHVHWHTNSAWFAKWCAGKTGFPVVDAGMRQLNTTGYMHNRARLIVASFLVKTLLISWEKGEKYFAQQLTDYDPASNNGNWQWIASTGADSQPYFRIFNPTEQSKNFDPDCEYIKTWLPELDTLPSKAIHHWPDVWSTYKEIKYPKPICDYKTQKALALKMYGQVFT